MPPHGSPLVEDGSSRPPHKPCLRCSYDLLPCQAPSVFIATIEVTTKRIAHPTNVPIATRWLLDTLHICACGLDAPFVSVGDIPTEYVLSKCAEIVINQDMLWMIVHF